MNNIYSKSDLQLSDKSLFDAIFQVGKELEKSHPELATKLLSNFNTYDVSQVKNMLNSFQLLLVNTIVETKKDVLDVDYVVKNKMTDLKQIIMFN